MRKTLRELLFSLCYYVGLFRLFAFLNRHRAVVLLYHAVTEDPEGKRLENWDGKFLELRKFRRQIDYLRQRYTILPLGALIELMEAGRPLPAYTAVITFDDGYRNLYTHAFPVLLSHRVPATLFLATGFVGTDRVLWTDRLGQAIKETGERSLELDLDGRSYAFNLEGEAGRAGADWELRRRLKGLPEEERQRRVDEAMHKLGVVSSLSREDFLFLSWGQVREMHRGGMGFGCHTENHLILSQVSPERASQEVLASREKLEEHLGERVEAFAYPNGQPGDFSPETQRLLLGLGFRCIALGIPGMNHTPGDLHQLKRLSVGDTDSFTDFLAGLSGFRQFLAQVLHGRGHP